MEWYNFDKSASKITPAHQVLVYFVYSLFSLIFLYIFSHKVLVSFRQIDLWGFVVIDRRSPFCSIPRELTPSQMVRSSKSLPLLNDTIDFICFTISSVLRLIDNSLNRWDNLLVESGNVRWFILVQAGVLSAAGLASPRKREYGHWSEVVSSAGKVYVSHIGFRNT